MVKNTAKEKNRSTLKNTKSGFYDPDRIKAQNKDDQPKDGVRSPWDYRCPQYDQRSSNFVNAGTHYGIGIKQPVGRVGNPEQTEKSLPTGRFETLQNDDLG